MSGEKIFSRIDITKAFFRANHKLLSWIRMPFDLKYGSTTFQRCNDLIDHYNKEQRGFN